MEERRKRRKAGFCGPDGRGQEKRALFLAKRPTPDGAKALAAGGAAR